MDAGDRRRIRVYLLNRMPEGERAAFEARLLEERDLLRAVRETEEWFLNADVRPSDWIGRGRVLCFSAGVLTGAAVLELAHRILA